VRQPTKVRPRAEAYVMFLGEAVPSSPAKRPCYSQRPLRLFTPPDILTQDKMHRERHTHCPLFFLSFHLPFALSPACAIVARLLICTACSPQYLLSLQLPYFLFPAFFLSRSWHYPAHLYSSPEIVVVNFYEPYDQPRCR